MSSTSLSSVRKMTSAEGARAVRKVISSYPSANPVALKEYLAELACVLSKYPEGIAIAGVEKAMRASPNFPPPIPLVEQHCAELAADSSYAMQWERHARQQLAERARIAQESEAEPLEHRRAVIERIRDEMAAAGMPLAEDRGRLERPSTWRQFTNEELLAIYGRRPAEDK